MLRHVAILPLVLTGCATARPTVSVYPSRSKQTLRQTFARAFVSQNELGEDQIVLVSDPLEQPADTAGQPLQSLNGPRIRQVLSIRLHWRAVGSRATSSAAMNAVLHWYVFGNPSGAGTGFVHYVGTGFVALSPEANGVNVIIDAGSLAINERYGDLKDPLNRFGVDGTFHADTNDVRVREVLADVAVAEAESKASVPHPPATAPTTRPSET